MEEMVGELRTRLGPHLPIRCHAHEVALVGELQNGTWVTRATFPLEGADERYGGSRCRGPGRGRAAPRAVRRARAGRLRGARRRRGRRARRLRPGARWPTRYSRSFPARRPSRSRRAGRTHGGTSTGPSSPAGSGSGRRGRRSPDPSRAVVIDPGRAFGTGRPSDDAPLCRRSSRRRERVGRCSTSVAARACSRSPPHGSGSRPCSPSTSTRRGRDDARERRGPTASTVDGTVLDALDGAASDGRRRSRQRPARPVETILARLERTRRSRRGTWPTNGPRIAGWEHVGGPRARRLGADRSDGCAGADRSVASATIWAVREHAMRSAACRRARRAIAAAAVFAVLYFTTSRRPERCSCSRAATGPSVMSHRSPSATPADG